MVDTSDSARQTGCLLECPSKEELQEVIADLSSDLAFQVDGPAHEDLIGQHWPVFTLLESLGVLLVWVVFAWPTADPWSTSWGRAGLDSVFNTPGLTTLKVYEDCEDRRWQIWRWWTYQFTHDNLSHVVCNVLVLIIIGVPLECFQGALRTFFIFNFAVLGSAFMHFVCNPHSALLGMSGGCFGLIGFQCAELGMNWFQTKFRWIKLVFLAIVVGSMTLEVQFGRLLHVADKSDHFAHLGGFACGLLLGVSCSRKIQDEWRKGLAQVLAASVGFGFILLCVVWFIQWPPRSLWDRVPWCWARQVVNTSHFGDRLSHCVRCGSKACIQQWTQWSQYPPRPVSWTECENPYGWDNVPW